MEVSLWGQPKLWLDMRAISMGRKVRSVRSRTMGTFLQEELGKFSTVNHYEGLSLSSVSPLCHHEDLLCCDKGLPCHNEDLSCHDEALLCCNKFLPHDNKSSPHQNEGLPPFTMMVSCLFRNNHLWISWKEHNLLLYCVSVFVLSVCDIKLQNVLNISLNRSSNTYFFSICPGMHH